MKAIFCKDLNAHYNNAILNVAMNSKLNSADLHLTNGGGGGRKSRLCTAHYPLNPNLSLYTLLFAFYFFVIASECIARVRQAIKSKMLCQIDCHAKNHSRSFLLAMTDKENALCHFAMTADFVILSLCKKAKNPQRLKENLPFLDTSLALSMTNSGFCLKITDIFTQILGTKFTNFIRFFGLPRSLCSLAMTARHKFKFFTQNSRHFINSIHFINSNHLINSKRFINLSQILSPTQGFCIFLPQIFEQFLLINLVERRSYGSSWHKRQDKNSRAD